MEKLPLLKFMRISAFQRIAGCFFPLKKRWTFWDDFEEGGPGRWTKKKEKNSLTFLGSLEVTLGFGFLMDFFFISFGDSD